MGLLHELAARLIEADVSVAANAQQLEVRVPKGLDVGVIGGALLSGVGGHAVGHTGILGEDIHMIKQIALHEVAVALIVVGGQPFVLVQVDGADVLEAEDAGLAPVSQALVSADRGGAGGQAQHAGRIVGDLRCHNLGGAAAYGLVVFLTKNLHNKHSFAIRFCRGSPEDLTIITHLGKKSR